MGRFCSAGVSDSGGALYEGPNVGKLDIDVDGDVDGVDGKRFNVLKVLTGVIV